MFRRVLIGLVAIFGVFVIAACGSSSDDPSSTHSQSTESDESSPDPDERSEDDDKLGDLLSGDPKDLTWKLGDPPSSWQQMETDEGKLQWAPAKYCVATFEQPAGFEDEEDMTEKEYIEKYVENMDSALNMNLEVSDHGDHKFSMESNSDAHGSVKASKAKLKGAKHTEGEIYAYIEGDFGLVLVTMCSNGYFDDVNDGEFEPFINNKVGIMAKY